MIITDRYKKLMTAQEKIYALYRLGILEEWCTEVVNGAGDRVNPAMFIIYVLKREPRWREFILASFVWRNSRMGADYWERISNLNMENEYERI